MWDENILGIFHLGKTCERLKSLKRKTLIQDTIISPTTNTLTPDFLKITNTNFSFSKWFLFLKYKNMPS